MHRRPEAVVGHHVQQHAVRRCKGDHEISPGNLAVKAVHLRHRQPQHPFVPLPCSAQDGGPLDLERRRAPGIKLDVGTALPALQNIRR
ncbi:hypothetical protein ACVWXN_007891 [Bradyrhizobium sp. i1.4.4]